MKKLLICTNYRANPNQHSCAARGSKALATDLAHLVKNEEVEIIVETSNCLGYCDIGINLKLSPNGDFIHNAIKSQDSQAKLFELIKEFAIK
ncbi:MAG: (2Fe-2S) ferredoxin domain-containing protein [Methylophilaceae bacterium]|nr:(2Fe-2S) ferredoxin domain-containing protein [Methylophilaceae bacterium]